ncbi:hypothetical protein HanHA300_Chr15g0588021 [Helianthus annuus]|nr:hypothetical protein HanHA300_Chr15g0588021 [Helianthus annuus]KAJ0654452.1 hypothetical protein HanOQP8_Chr15g0595131 [Helianthus annuus]
MFVDSVYMLSFQYHCSNIVVSMKLPFTHQPFNIDVAVSLLQYREKLHVLPSLMGELHCSIFVKSKVSFSCIKTLLHSFGTLMEESGGLHRAMLCCSRFCSFYQQIEEQVYEDRATLQELKRCFDGLQVGLFMREQVSRNLMRMPSTSVRELCVVSNIECGDRDVEFMAMLKDIHREVQQSMELKLKFLNSCCYYYVDVELCLNICLVSQQRFNSIKGWFDGEHIMLMLNCV